MRVQHRWARLRRTQRLLTNPVLRGLLPLPSALTAWRGLGCQHAFQVDAEQGGAFGLMLVHIGPFGLEEKIWSSQAAEAMPF